MMILKKGVGNQSYLRIFLRFRKSMNGEAINVSEVLRIPPLIDIRESIAASSEIEKCEYENRLLEMRWISQLVQPDSFLGRAHPKGKCD